MKTKETPLLKVITGGKGPSGSDWLSPLQQGTAFSCKTTGNVDYINIYVIAFKHRKTIILQNGIDNNRFAVDPKDFCMKHQLFEVIGFEDGNSETVRHRRVADDADAPGGQPDDGELGQG